MQQEKQQDKLYSYQSRTNECAQVTGLMGGYPGQTQTTVTPNPTPLANCRFAATGAGIYSTYKQKGSIKKG